MVANGNLQFLKPASLEEVGGSVKLVIRGADFSHWGYPHLEGCQVFGVQQRFALGEKS
jgi:hypothetical protein